MRDYFDGAAFGAQIGRQLMQGMGAFEEGKTKMGQMLAQQDAARAKARQHDEQAAQLRQAGKYRTPEFGNQIAAALSGLVGDQPAQMEQFQRTGNWGTREFVPSAFDAQDLGSMAGQNKVVEDTPAWATPEKIGAYQQALGAHYLNLAGTGDSNARNIADAYDSLRTRAGADRAITEPGFAPRFAMAQAAAAGKPLYDNAGGDAVFNQFTGGDIISTKAEAEAVAPLLSDLFGGQQYQAEGDDASGWRLMPVSGAVYLDDQGNPVAEPRKTSINSEMARALGIDEQRLAVLARLAETSPKHAAQIAQGLIRHALRPPPAERLPAGLQEFRAYMAMPAHERTAYKAWNESRRPSSAVTVVNDAMKTHAKGYGTLAIEALQSAQTAFDQAEDVDMIVDGLRGMGGGPLAEFQAFIGKLMPATSDWGKMASMSELARTIQAKLAPTLRVVGSGATTDFEMRLFMSAIPTLATTENGRELMAKYMRRVAERAQIRAEIVNDIEQSGSLPTPKLIAAEMRRRLPGRFFDAQDRAFFGLKDRPATQSMSPGTAAAPADQARPPLQRGQVRDGYRFKGGDPADPKNWEKLK